MTTLWKLSITGPNTALMTAAERLDALEHPAVLSWSVFDEDGEAETRLDVLTDRMIDAAALATEIGAAGEGFEARYGLLPDADWVRMSLRALSPVEAGRFVVYGGHDAPDTGGRIGIEIEAGPAFGTGHHGTTRGCLLAFDTLLEARFEPRRVLDLGCGSAVLAIAAAKALPGAHVLASDIEPESIEEASLNIEKNDVAGIVCFAADGFDHPRLEGGRFDLVFANILAGPLVDLAPRIAGALNPGGAAILSGLLTGQVEMVRDAYRAQGLVVKRREPIEEWETLIAWKG